MRSNVPRWRGQGVDAFETYVVLVIYALRAFVHLRHCVTPPPAEDISGLDVHRLTIQINPHP